jgi:hypothetical protein
VNPPTQVASLSKIVVSTNSKTSWIAQSSAHYVNFIHPPPFVADVAPNTIIVELNTSLMWKTSIDETNRCFRKTKLDKVIHWYIK